MNPFPFQEWLEKTAQYSGVLACGVRLPNKSSSVKTYHESFPEARIGELLQCLTEVAFTLRNSKVGGARLRWIFANGQIYSARRPDGATAVLATGKDPAASAIEELFADFLAMTSAYGPPPMQF
jgi:hypothetical protein